MHQNILKTQWTQLCVFLPQLSKIFFLSGHDTDVSFEGPRYGQRLN